MAAAELTRAAPPRTRSSHGPAGAFLATYTALWASTLIAATLTAAVPCVAHTARGALGLTLIPAQNPPATLGRVLRLGAHNLPIAAWPLLLGLAGIARSRPARHATDMLLAGCTLANTLPVGGAIGAYGGRLLPYIPQLPLEWAALAAGYCSWLVQRQHPISGRQRVAWLALTAVLVVTSAAVETSAVPRRAPTHTSAATVVQPVHQLRMKGASVLDAEHRAAAAKITREHAARQEHDAPLTRRRTVEVGVAEHQQTLDLGAHEAFDVPRLRIGLAQPAWTHARHPNAPTVALRLHREQATRTNRHVIHVAAARVDVVQSDPALGGQSVENPAYEPLTLIATLTTLEHPRDTAISHQHRRDQQQRAQIEERRMPGGKHTRPGRQRQHRHGQNSRRKRQQGEHQRDSANHPTTMLRRRSRHHTPSSRRHTPRSTPRHPSLTKPRHQRRGDTDHNEQEPRR